MKAKSVIGSLVFIIATIAAVGAFILSCQKKETVKEEKVEAKIAVNTQEVYAQNLDDYLEFGGDVTSSSSIQVLPNISGKVVQLTVKAGDKVSKNQTIALVNASKPGTSYASSPVKSPIAGTIVSLPQNVGSSVSTSTAVAEIASTDKLEVLSNIPARFISRVRLGEKAIITFDAYEGESFAATVSEVSPVLNPTTRTMEVKLSFDEKNDKIKSGMYAHIKLITGTVQNAAVIPSKALVQINGESFVYTVMQVAGQARAHKTAVQVGLTVDGMAEIVSGLREGDEVVVKGQGSISDGQLLSAIKL